MRIRCGHVILVLMFVFCLAACGGNGESAVENTVEPIDIVEEQSTEDEKETIVPETEDSSVTDELEENSLPVIYDGNENINLYLNRYNEVNPDSAIESSDFEVYNHHGRDHEDQIIYYLNDFEYVISSLGIDLQVDVQGVLHSGKSVEDYKQEFIKYARGYDASLSDETLEGYWDQAISNAVSFTEFEEFELYLRIYDDTIEAMQLKGEIQ